ncbi:MAG: hypothetical protein AB1921_00030 [Thermodesulfobacteriota bacterium]
MALIATVPPEKAEGKVKKAYDIFLKMGPAVPAPFQMLSASPDLLEAQAEIVRYFMGHKTLSFMLLAHIRLLTAVRTGYEFCTNFNAGLLTMMGGVPEEKLDEVIKDPTKADLPENEKAMLLFVLKAVAEPDSVTEADINKLRGLGWAERDMFDALVQAANMVTAGILFRTFKMDDCAF